MDIGTQMRLTGLATGLDTDEVIRNMGRVHNLRIDAVNRERQLAVWRQEIYRSTMDMLSGFQKTNFNFGSPANNFLSASAFAKFSYNLSLGGDAAKAGRIMSVTANGDLKNFNQSVQAVAQLATKDTWNGKSMDLQGIKSEGFNIENFGDRVPASEAHINAMRNAEIDLALWGDSDLREAFKDFASVEFADWNFDNWIKTNHASNGFEQWCKNRTDVKDAFEEWCIEDNGGINDNDAWITFWAKLNHTTEITDITGLAVEDLLDEFKSVTYGDAGEIEEFAWNTFRRSEGKDLWSDFLELSSNLDEVERITNEVKEAFGDGSQYDTVNFRYAVFGMSIDNVSRTITISNDELQAIYGNHTFTAEDRANGFAKLLNERIELQFGKEFNNLVSVTKNGELKIDKAGSSVAVFEEDGFDSLKRMGFATGASNRNFGGKTIGDLFPDMFGQATDSSGRSLFITNDGTTVYKVDNAGIEEFFDRTGRQVFIDKDGKSVFRTGVDQYVDKDGRPVASGNVTKPLSGSDVKPSLLNETTTIHINGKAINISATDTISSMISKVNSSDAAVNLAYDAIGDKFVMTSVGEGSISNINVTMGEMKDGKLLLSASAAFFYALGIVEEADGGSVKYVDRQEAQNLRAVINNQEVVKFSNSFAIDGMTYSFKETFNSTIASDTTYVRAVGDDVSDAEGYKLDSSGNRIVDVEKGSIIITDPKEEIKIQVTKNTDDIISSIRNFVDEYNKIIDHINTLMYQKKDRNYPPLTDEQKKAMKEEEIAAWEDKAKAGLLSGDMELRRLLDQMRMAVYQPVEGAGISMAEIGIATTANYKDGGRLAIDEEKLKAAVDGKYESVVKLFTKRSDIPYGNGDQSQRYNENGLANRLNDIISDAVRTTTVNGRKGYMVEKAGALNDATSVTNQITKQIEQYDKRISVLIDRWKRQEKSYYDMFSRMESAMMKLQTQQNNLASLMAQTGN